VFQGGFFYKGVDFYEKVSIPDRPGTHWPAGFPEPTREEKSVLKKDRRLVLVTGDLDFNRTQTEVYSEKYRRAGFRHVTYLQIPNADHYGGLDASYLDKGIQALDEPLGK
ncbi:MAG: hypothetical protein AAGD38_15635, partial [Acidobacteriota bacterium]